MANEIVFEASTAGVPLRQGEILSSLVEYVFDPSIEEVEAVMHPYCVVVTQDCDLARDYEARAAGDDSTIRSILLLKADSEAEARNTINSNVWRQAKQNSLERWQVLEPAQPDQDLAGQGLPVLVTDFRKYFTIPPHEVYRQIASGGAHRRSLLLSPYREHLQIRLMTYMARVALDRDHAV